MEDDKENPVRRPGVMPTTDDVVLKDMTNSTTTIPTTTTKVRAAGKVEEGWGGR